MQTTITWQGIYYHSLEHCTIAEVGDGHEIRSAITGTHKQRSYKIDYNIHTDKNWDVRSVTIDMTLDGASKTITAENSKGAWTINKKPAPQFKGLSYVDISLTPLTNTLPINGLSWTDREPRIIDVVYFDILAGEITPSKQVYTRLSKNEFLFQTYDRSFEEQITVNDEGIVTNYPQLFKMVSER